MEPSFKTKDSTENDMKKGLLQRVKFRCRRRASIDPDIEGEEWRPLAAALETSEELGAAPTDELGRVHGNGAILGADGSSIVVSRSGRHAGTRYDAGQFVRAFDFDIPTWTALYASSDPGARPSSDLPLLWHALRVAPDQFGWEVRPRFVLHGHTCQTQKEAARLGSPCSTEETMFSTPADLEALRNLLEKHPYPQHRIFVRLNHGFFLLAETSEEAIQLFETKIRKKSRVQMMGDLLSSKNIVLQRRRWFSPCQHS